jgi:hypothetical protein
MSPWQRGAVDIASASGMRGPGFESRQGIGFLGKHCSAVVFKMTLHMCFVCVLKGEIKALASKTFKKIANCQNVDFQRANCNMSTS